LGDTRRTNDRSSGFKSVKQVGVAVSIGFPLMVIGVLTLVVFLISWVGTATALWIIAAVVLALGIIGSLSGRVV
jgi:Flp pilus assembly protein TadB